MKIYEANITHIDEVTDLLVSSSKWTGLELQNTDVIRALAVSSSLYIIDTPIKGVIGVQKYFPHNNNIISVFGAIGNQKYEIAEALLRFIIDRVDDLDGIYMGKNHLAKKFMASQGYIMYKEFEEQIFYKYTNGSQSLTADLKKT